MTTTAPNPQLSAPALRRPGAEDPLTCEEQDRLFGELKDHTADILRMQATLKHYRRILASAGELGTAERLLPERLQLDGFDYLVDEE